MKTVKLSPETRAILKVAASINNSIKVEAGNSIKVVHPTGSIVFEAEVAETFPETFSIYEMNRFLSVLNLPNMQDADLIFTGTNYVSIKAGKAEVKYKFTTEEFATHPGREIALPTEDLSVDISNDDINNLQKMAAALGHKIMQLQVSNGRIFLSTTTPELEDASNDSSIDMGDANGSVDGLYRIKFDNLILVPGDYKVTISSAGIARFEHKIKKIKSFIGLERQ